MNAQIIIRERPIIGPVGLLALPITITEYLLVLRSSIGAVLCVPRP